MKTVKQMVQKATQEQRALLSNFDADFWAEYVTNYTRYDDYFAMLYKNFVYFDQEETDSIEDVAENFTFRVYNYLLANSKRLSELWRINVVPDDEAYAITENYFMVEEYTGSNGSQSALTSGQRTDINNLQVGSQNSGVVNKVTGFNSSNENTNTTGTSSSGSRNDITQFTKGQETDTSRTTGTDAHNIKRHGSLGVMTADDVIKKHEELWKNTDLFYEFVMREICERFLIIGE